MTITYYGHSCFGVEVAGKHLLFDPFISHNPLAKDIKMDEIPCDFMLISHPHFDHFADAEPIAKRTNCTVICLWETGNLLKENGVTNVWQMNIGGKKDFGAFSVKCVAAVHSSGLAGAAAMGFVVSSEEGTFYFAGDTALTLDMQLIPMLCPPLGFAILPIGSNLTMDVADAVVAADFIACDTVIGCHYDTWQPIEIDHEAAIKAFEAEGKTLILPKIGGELQWG